MVKLWLEALTAPNVQRFSWLVNTPCVADQGSISKGDMLYNLNSGKKLKVPRLVRMHSAEMQVRCAYISRALVSRDENEAAVVLNEVRFPQGP